jgi:ribonucleoside-diphosphate reductase alpha chain
LTRAWIALICREVAANLRELARKQTPVRLSLDALYELLEKTLVDNNAYFVAKSLLMNRARKIATTRESAAQSTLRVIRRNKQVVPWSDQKVEIAVRKTFLSLQRDSAPAVAITKAVTGRVHASKQSFVHIEEVQDMVQEEIMKAGHYKVAEAYILFRAQRAVARETGLDSSTSDSTPPMETSSTTPALGRGELEISSTGPRSSRHRARAAQAAGKLSRPLWITPHTSHRRTS